MICMAQTLVKDVHGADAKVLDVYLRPLEMFRPACRGTQLLDLVSG